MDSEGTNDQHDTMGGLDGGGANSSNAFQDELDDLFLQFLEEGEERLLLETMPDVHGSDTQSEKQDTLEGEGDGNQSVKQKQECSESSDDNDSASVEEGDSDGEQSKQPEPECSEHIGSSSDVVDLGEPSQVQRLVLSPGSKSLGVTYHKKDKCWEAHIWVTGRKLRDRKKNGVQVFGGKYRTEDEAKQAHDRMAIKFDIRLNKKGKIYSLNFSESAQADFMSEYRVWSIRDFLWMLRRSSPKFSWGKSDMKGVTVRTPARKRLKPGEEESGRPAPRYAAKISLKGKDKIKRTANIGTYGSEEDAGKAYDRALLFISKDKDELKQWNVITNFKPSDYTDAEILEAGSKLVFK